MSTAWCCRVCLLVMHNAVGLGLFLGGGWAEVTTGRVPALQDSPFLKNQAPKVSVSSRRGSGTARLRAEPRAWCLPHSPLSKVAQAGTDPAPEGQGTTRGRDQKAPNKPEGSKVKVEQRQGSKAQGKALPGSSQRLKFMDPC